MDGGVVGRALDSRFAAFLMFVILVWLAVALGIVLAGLIPQLPDGARAIMAPTLTEGGKHAPVSVG